MQRVLDEEGTGQSARQFAQAHGLDVGKMFRQPEDQTGLSRQVQDLLSKPGTASGITHGINPSGPAPPPEGAATVAGAPGTATGIPAGFVHSAPPGAPAHPNGGAGAKVGVPAGYHSSVPPPAEAPLPASGSTRVPAIPTASAPTSVPSPSAAGMPALQTPSVPTGAGTPSTSAPLTPTAPPQALTPGELIHSFDKGLENGAPFTAPTNAIPPAPPTESQVPQAVPTSPSAELAAPAHAPVYDSPPPVAHTPIADASAAPPMMAGPATPAGPVSATPPTGPLPAYASDLRPAISAATTPAAPPSSPLPATPGSAPVHPSAGQGSPAQPAVVRQATAQTQPSGASSLGTQAVAATATGAVAGAASANATARARLQRLVGAVARQQPRLAWAIGDRADNSTVLATDLASGWIPPGIELPTGVTLLSPERRRGSLEILLGDVTVAAGYTPIHHIPDEDEPVPTSTRPRRVPEIEELGWELSQAVQWRDGLPRLTHTLAKAASSGTGVLDKEVELLHEHLAAISTRVLDAYPDDVDTHDVGNWQLLAAVDALVAGDKSAANYHLAWFQACSMTTAHTQSR
jgi:hypothetical protein